MMGCFPLFYSKRTMALELYVSEGPMPLLKKKVQ